MAKSNAQLEAELAKLTEAHEVMVKSAVKQNKLDAATIAILKKTNEKKDRDNEALKAKNEAMKASAKKQREEKAEVQKSSMQAKLDAEPHHWVQVFYKGLADGVDFAFNYEGVQFVMHSGKPVFLAISVINHLKTRSFPITTEKQGEAGQPVRVFGRHHNFSVVNCEEPEKVAKVG